MIKNGLIFATMMMTLSLTGCLFRTRKIEPHRSSATLQEATPDQLIQKINDEAAKIHTLNATIDMSASAGGTKKGKVTDYSEIRGYILLRKPAMLRMIGLLPIVRSRAFDMVSDGQQFKLFIPPKNRFVVGRNDTIRPARQSLENLRPQHVLDALLVQAIDEKDEIAVLEAGTEVVRDPKGKKLTQEPTYIIDILRRDREGWFLSRKVIFDREDLKPHRQIVYDRSGNLATDARYEQFRDYNGLLFPSVIQIERPQEEYSIVLSVLKLRLNEPLKDEQFVLQQPAGTQLVQLDTATPAPVNSAPVLPSTAPAISQPPPTQKQRPIPTSKSGQKQTQPRSTTGSETNSSETNSSKRETVPTQPQITEAAHAQNTGSPQPGPPADLKTATAQLLEATEANLKSLTNVTNEMRATVDQIHDYLKQANEALTGNESERAYNLALKANLLSKELVK